MSEEHRHYTEIPGDGWDCANERERVAERVEKATADAAYWQTRYEAIAPILEKREAERDEARNLIAEVLQTLPEAGKDNDDVYSVWNRLYKGAHWLHPQEEA